ncbi:MAG: PAS domain S-box protein [Bacteroidia bacterium]|nr:PAS domain S-box protein [Bacteroidia bacterium]
MKKIDSDSDKAELNLRKNEIEFELLSSKQLFQLLIQNSNDSICLIDAEGNQVFLNNAAEKTTGYSIEELLGPFSKVIIPEDLPKVMQAWGDVLQNPDKVIKIQYKHIHKTKPYIWMEAVGQNHLSNPALNAVVVNVRDITVQKEIEELINAKNEELFHLNSIKDKLIEDLDDLLNKRKKELTTNALMLKQLSIFHSKILSELKLIKNCINNTKDEKLSELIAEITSSLKLINWKDFQNRYEEINQDYLKLLSKKFPSLSPTDCKILSYVKLGFSSKEMSALTQNSIESIQVARSRLRKKLGLSTSENLYKFIIQL